MVRRCSDGSAWPRGLGDIVDGDKAWTACAGSGRPGFGRSVAVAGSVCDVVADGAGRRCPKRRRAHMERSCESAFAWMMAWWRHGWGVVARGRVGARQCQRGIPVTRWRGCGIQGVRGSRQGSLTRRRAPPAPGVRCRARRGQCAEVASCRCQERHARRGSCHTTHGEACRGNNEMERLRKGNVVAARRGSW
jgi:hypothetical protein